MLNIEALNARSFGKFTIGRILSILLVCLLFGLVIVDRAGWATVSQWREDQAANLWLGYTRSPLDLPVGLISSYDIPNPNGLPLLAVPLSRLPGLFSISTFLGMLQAGLIVWVVWLVFGATWTALVVLGPLLSSVFLRAISVEFWGQWLMVPVDLLFFGLAVSYLRHPRVELLPVMLVVVLLPASLYLAGIANALVFGLIFLVLILANPPKNPPGRWVLSAAAGLGVLVAFLALTWLPYIQAVEWGQITAVFTGKFPWTQKLLTSASALLRFPRWSVLQWSRETLALIYQSSPEILPPSSGFMITSAGVIQWVQVLLALAGLVLYFLSLRRSSGAVSRPRAVLPTGAWAIALAFSLLSCSLSPLLGGPDWTRFERPDQSIQLLPFLIFLWFSTPFAFEGAFGSILKRGTVVLASLYVATNLILGYQVISSHLNYRGDVLSEADVPLVQKIQAVDFIARDWLQRSGSQPIPVAYDLEGRWPWINEMGESMNRWYPAPMITGRGFDYEFSRRYGLTNAQEGTQIREESEARYVITYAFQSQSNEPASCRHIFGRLLVLIDCPP
jgi:hypothetical protein